MKTWGKACEPVDQDEIEPVQRQRREGHFRALDPVADAARVELVLATVSAHAIGFVSVRRDTYVLIAPQHENERAQPAAGLECAQRTGLPIDPFECRDHQRMRRIPVSAGGSARSRCSGSASAADTIGPESAMSPPDPWETNRG